MLFSYDEVLRDPNTFILKLILSKKNIRDQMEKYINLKRFDCQTDEHNHAIMTARKKKNILEWLAYKKFDYEKNYDTFHSKYIHTYEKSQALEMYRALTNIIDQAFVKKVYIYNKTEDKRQMYDLFKTFGKNDKIVYVNGNYLDVVERIGDINIIIDNDIDRIAPLFSYPTYANTLFMVGRYGYNYEENKALENGYELKGGLTKFVAKHKINLVEFSPMKITPEVLRNG